MSEQSTNLSWEEFLPSHSRSGQVWSWGRGSHGQLGHDVRLGKTDNCPLPEKIAMLSDATWIAAGGGQQGMSAAVQDGKLYTWGNDSGRRLGHKEAGHVSVPRCVGSLESVTVTQVACGTDHAMCLSIDGAAFTWGINKDGCLGRDLTKTAAFDGTHSHVPGIVRVTQDDPIIFIDCEHRYSAAVTSSGVLFTWGLNDFGQLGHGDTSNRALPCPVALITKSSTDSNEVNNDDLTKRYLVATVGLGSMYAGAVTRCGRLFMWGYGGHGNLGLGSRKSTRYPKLVDELASITVVQVSCTKAQVGCKGGLRPKVGGTEGPHTVVLSSEGKLYTFGTCHKGLLLNFGNKTGGFNSPFDELSPYLVGSAVRNGTENPPLSRLSVWPPPYSSAGPFCFCVSAHIHCAAIARTGQAYAWGCGSNDGRCGVERFLNASGDGKPPKVDHMKCYLMNPHEIGYADKKYWPAGSTLQGVSVISLATGRNHMLCTGRK